MIPNKEILGVNPDKNFESDKFLRMYVFDVRKGNDK